MIELYISTPREGTTTKEIATLLASRDVESAIFPNHSTVPRLDEYGDSHTVVETGFYIQIFNVKAKRFKNRVWRPLQTLLQLNIRCAFVKHADIYTGCVMNWPGVFAENNCSAYD